MPLAVNVGNSSSQLATALLLVGSSSAYQWLPTYGATLHVANPTLVPLFYLPPSGQTITFYLPPSTILLGLGFAAQTLIIERERSRRVLPRPWPPSSDSRTIGARGAMTAAREHYVHSGAPRTSQPRPCQSLRPPRSPAGRSWYSSRVAPRRERSLA